MEKVVMKSLGIRLPEEVIQDNLKVLKLRCRSFLKPENGEAHSKWESGGPHYYFAMFNIVASDDGKNYKVGSMLEKISEFDNKKREYKTKYELSFDDMQEVLDDQSYRPLRTLGNLVFNNSSKNRL